MIGRFGLRGEGLGCGKVSCDSLEEEGYRKLAVLLTGNGDRKADD